MRRRQKRPLARTKTNTDKVRFFDRISYPATYALSPFYPCRFYLDNFFWTSVIHHYQASKFCWDQDIYHQIRQCETPEEAKKIAASGVPIDDWFKNRYGTMKDATYAKFTQNKDCMTVLIATGTKPLIEDSHDSYWGTKNYGENNMGKLLEEVRLEVRKKLRLE